MKSCTISSISTKPANRAGLCDYGSVVVASAKNDKSTGSSVYVYYKTTTLHKYGRSMIYARRDDRVSEGPEFLAELCAVEIQASREI